MIAIDIVLLLPEEIIDLCIEINRKFKRNIDLGKKDFIPHISLGMACVDEKDLEKIKKALPKIKRLYLEIEKIKYYETDEGKKSSFSIKKNEKLQKLHEQVMDILSPLIKCKVSEEMIVGDELSERSRQIINNYEKEFAYEHYWPHITLSCFDANYEKVPIKFTVDTLAIFQLGNGCTCRKIINKKIKKEVFC